MNTEKLLPDNREEPAPSPDVDAALAEIEHTLHMMLALAEVSASSLDLDRDTLQKTLARLQDKIDRIASQMEDA